MSRPKACSSKGAQAPDLLPTSRIRLSQNWLPAQPLVTHSSTTNLSLSRLIKTLMYSLNTSIR